MKEELYGKIQGDSQQFILKLDEHNRILSIKNPEDSYGMNWTSGKNPWGKMKCNLDLSVDVSRYYTDNNTLVEEYRFCNHTAFDLYVTGTMLGIYTPFTDYYTDADICMRQCCNTHIWCGGGSSYIMALRMGGKAPHLGMVLREGGLKGYSIERPRTTEGRLENLSNHRGDIILHPENFHLRPEETYTLAWELFWFQDKEDFKKKLSGVEGIVVVDAPNFVLTEKEKITFTVSLSGFEDGDESPVVTRDGREIPILQEKGSVVIEETPEGTGEYQYDIRWKGKTGRAAFLVVPALEELIEKRCRFIANNQQCHDEESHLYGAYLIYDNEEKCQYYGHLNDHNGGRERIGMGVLMARYLQGKPDSLLEASLDLYVDYVMRELYDEETGEVFNDVQRNKDDIRLYNYPWVCCLFLELYRLKKEEVFLDRFYQCACAFYEAGGSRFYAIGMPMEESVMIFNSAGRKTEAAKLLEYYKVHGDYIIKCGYNYPAHEVNYEQSIVAPAADYMCQLYRLTGETVYKDEAVRQLHVLDLFQGFQPDYHMNETAIRHWDGFWFGKWRCLGDTFPHYWSALSGCAFWGTKEIAGTDYFEKKAEKNIRAVLSLFKEDGSASCAMVYPLCVNGQYAHFYDPWANDQDWGLYFVLKYLY